MKSLDSPLEKERDFEPHHKSPSVKTMIDNWHNKYWHTLIWLKDTKNNFGKKERI